MRDSLRRLLRPPRPEPLPAPHLGFGAWTDLRGEVLGVCHPQWRGVRTAAHAFGDPVAETADAGTHAEEIVAGAAASGVGTLVVHGFPPGAGQLLRTARDGGMATRVTVHSSMAQHVAEAGEAAMMDEVVDLAREGVLDRIGFVKAGLAEVFSALGLPAMHTPNRAPQMPVIHPFDPGPDGPHFGVFGDNYWRKNVGTQLGAVTLLGGTAHVMIRPPARYMAAMTVREHGEMDRDSFLSVQAAMDLNLYATLSECHPMGPLESFLSGVPALLSRTSDLFRSDPELWEVVTTDSPDDPTLVAAAVERLLDEGEDVVTRAREWIAAADAGARERWAQFLS